MARSSWIQNPICQLRTVTILFTFAFFITRHACHRCVYLMVIVIFAVVACTITFFIKTYWLTSFLTVFRWLGTSCDHMILRSTSITFPRRTFRISVRWNTNRESFFLFLSDPFETFFRRMIIRSKKCALFLGRVCPLIVSTRPWDSVVKIQIICLQGWDIQTFLIRILFLSSHFCLLAS